MNLQLHRTGALVIHGARCLVSVVSPDGRADGGAVYEVPYSTPEDQEAERETGTSVHPTIIAHGTKLSAACS